MEATNNPSDQLAESPPQSFMRGAALRQSVIFLAGMMVTILGLPKQLQRMTGNLRNVCAFRLLPLLLLLLALPAAVQAQDYTYTTNNGTIIITRYTGPGGSVAIPGTINGLPVTGIGDIAFQGNLSLISITIPNSVTAIGGSTFENCTNLNTVTIPDSVISIGSFAFNNCSSLMSVTIPNGVTSIDFSAFSKDTSLTSVTIPASVTNIGFSAFYSCTGLIGITVDALNSAYASEDGVLFNKSQTTLIQCPGGKTGSYRTPDAVTYIAAASFSGCGNLTSVAITDGVTNINGGAFSYCANLTSVTISSGIASIGYGAFYGCTALAEVYFRGNAPSVDYNSHVFDGVTNVIAYYLPGTSGWDQFSYESFIGTALWQPQIQTSGAGFGVQTNQFGFNINWASGQTVVVEACTILANPGWSPVGTNTITDGTSYFSDPQWTNYPARFYRLRSP